MSDQASTFGRVREFAHRYFLWLLVAAYLLAAIWPTPGNALRHAALGISGVVISLPMMLLAVLLFNAGLGAGVSELAAVVRRPRDLLAGVGANLLVPIAFLTLLAYGLRWWHDSSELQGLLVGLAVVAAMPVAGSSAAWSQNAGGNPALSLGLVILSTLLSPVTTPFTLATVGPLTDGDYAAALRQMSGRSTGAFLLACVVLPSVAGMVSRRLLGGARIHPIKPTVKFLNAVVLLVLCYANAASVLPQITAEPDWDFLALILLAAVTLCATTFVSGWGVARLLRADEARKRSLVFALGMNNNGTGLVLACWALAKLPGAILPVLVYNLVQHLIAGGVNNSLARGKIA
jgi:BASS family bile acid:Na+ symporter